MDRVHEMLTLVAVALSGLFGLLVQEVSYIALPLPAPEPHTEVLFVGDMMFDRTIRQAMDAHGPDFVFSCIESTLAGGGFCGRESGRSHYTVSVEKCRFGHRIAG